jgi:hypothetical protein
MQWRVRWYDGFKCFLFGLKCADDNTNDSEEWRMTELLHLSFILQSLCRSKKAAFSSSWRKPHFLRSILSKVTLYHPAAGFDRTLFSPLTKNVWCRDVPNNLASNAWNLFCRWYRVTSAWCCVFWRYLRIYYFYLLSIFKYASIHLSEEYTNTLPVEHDIQLKPRRYWYQSSCTE